MTAPSLRPIKFGGPGEEISKKDLIAVARRFQNVHKRQLERIQDSLTARQREFLDLLPLLFHTNHPLLPGFVNIDTPAGVPDYVPTRQTVLCAQRISKSFEYRRRALPQYPIRGIFLMGSVGSIAYSKHSDLDIWLCHSPELDERSLADLHQKAVGIERWASSLGLEVHIFFINPEGFRQGVGQPLSTESCGSIQHHLLLEEFYRTSLYIAGHTPAWWLVPPEYDHAYTGYLQHLVEKRFINADEVIDLGGLENVSAEEFLGGTLWHLFKAIGAPYKSLLKLMLMESYSGEFPRPDWLCTRLKAAVHGGVTDVAELDSYVLMYRKVETHLRSRQEWARLELARQCFYLKVNGAPSIPERASAETQGRRQQIRDLVADWNWGSERFSELDKRRRWRIAEIIEEHSRITRELTSSYQGVSRFVRDHAQAFQSQPNEIRKLGRCLFAALEKKPGKVEILSNDSYDELEPEDLSLHESRLADGEEGWIVYPGRIKPGDKLKPKHLKKSPSLLEILAWLTLNGFYRKTTNVYLETVESRLDGSEFRSIMTALHGFLERSNKPEESLDAYGSAARVASCALFVNLGYDHESGRKDGMQVTSNRFDALSFGSEHVNLVHTIDQIRRTSWHESLVSQYRGLSGLFDCLCEIINQCGEFGEPPALEVLSFSSIRSRSIATRVEGLYLGLLDAFGASESLNYFVRGGDEFYMFTRERGALRYRKVADETSMFAELRRPRLAFEAVIFDPLAMEASPLPSLFKKNRAGWVQVYFQHAVDRTEVFILDERGSLFIRLHIGASPEKLLNAYTTFLAAIQQRYVLSVRGVEFRMIAFSAGRGYELVRLPWKATISDQQISVRVYGLERSTGQVSYTICCDDQEFSAMDLGRDLYRQVSDFIYRNRREGERYPIHISDVDVPLPVLGVEAVDHLQTIHLLDFKTEIEERLNQ